MISKYLAMLPAAAALLLAGCSKEGTEYSEELTEIRLTGSIAAQTRATHGLDTQFADGEQVHVWVDDAGNGDALYEDNVLTAGSDGTLSGGSVMYFPSSGNAVDIYAVHGNFGSADLGSFWGGSVTHTVEADQTTAGGGYAVSDLVYGKSADVARTGSAVSLKLNHMLSKVEVVLKQGDGSPEISKAEILNTLLGATFTPDKDNGISVTASGSAGAIEIDAGLTASGAAEILNEAVVVPQTIADGTQLFRITTSAGGVLCYAASADVIFEAGKKYRYTVTASLSGLSVTAEIGVWTDDVGASGTATRFQDYTVSTDANGTTYTVYTEAGLLAWAEYVREGNYATNCTLVADITMSTVASGSSNWTAVGDESNIYTGIFDGNGHTITNLTISATSDNQGLIGWLGPGGEVKDLTLEEVSISSTGVRTGGVAGINDGSVTNCSVSGDVSGTEYTGGVVGESKGTVTGCSFSGSVDGTFDTGGVAGTNDGNITACYSTGLVSSLSLAGGVVGVNHLGTVTACYSTATVSDDAETGGVVGENAGSVTSCYWYNSTTTSGIGTNSGTDGTSKVDGTSVTWSDAAATDVVAMSSMNEALSNGGYAWQYVANSKYDGSDTSVAPLLLEPTE